MSNKTATAKKSVEEFLKPLTTARHAYIGLHGFAYDRAKMRRKQVQSFVKEQFETYVSKGTNVEEQVVELTESVKVDLSEKIRLPRPTNLLKKVRQSSDEQVAELEAQVEKLNEQLEKMAKKKASPAKKSVAKKPVAKKTVMTEKVIEEKSSGDIKTTTTKLVETPQTSEATTEVKTEVKAAAETDKYAPYVADVQRYDAKADASVIRKIVIHCGIALRNNDGRYVACSDEAERQTVRNSWLTRKLGVDGETAELDKKVLAVCETMKADRMKNRVTFYYLLAKNEDKLSTL